MSPPGQCGGGAAAHANSKPAREVAEWAWGEGRVPGSQGPWSDLARQAWCDLGEPAVPRHTQGAWGPSPPLGPRRQGRLSSCPSAGYVPLSSTPAGKRPWPLWEARNCSRGSDSVTGPHGTSQQPTFRPGTPSPPQFQKWNCLALPSLPASHGKPPGLEGTQQLSHVRQPAPPAGKGLPGEPPPGGSLRKERAEWGGGAASAEEPLPDMQKRPQFSPQEHLLKGTRWWVVGQASSP